MWSFLLLHDCSESKERSISFESVYCDHRSFIFILKYWLQLSKTFAWPAILSSISIVLIALLVVQVDFFIMKLTLSENTRLPSRLWYFSLRLLMIVRHRALWIEIFFTFIDDYWSEIKKLAAPFVQQQANAPRATAKKFVLSSAATATAGAITMTTASLSSSQSLSQSTDDSSTAPGVMTQSNNKSSSPISDMTQRQKLTTIPNNHLSSVPSQDDASSSTSSNKTRLLQRMISLRRSSSTKPATPLLSPHNSSTTASTCRSYNLRAFEIARDRNLRHYPCVVHFLDDTERTFHIDVSWTWFLFAFSHTEQKTNIHRFVILASLQRYWFTQWNLRIFGFIDREKIFRFTYRRFNSRFCLSMARFD